MQGARMWLHVQVSLPKWIIPKLRPMTVIMHECLSAGGEREREKIAIFHTCMHGGYFWEGDS